MMAFMMTLLAASVIGSLIWLALTLLSPLTQKVFSQTWHYYAGLIPAFFMTGAAWAISSGINAVAALTRTNTPVIPEPSSELGAGLAPPVFTYNYGGVIEKTGETVAKAKMSIDMFAPIILAVWLIGAIVFLVWKVAAYARFRRGVSKIGNLSADTDCKLSVLVCPGAATPMLVGVFKAVIVLPERDYNERERRLILSHETAHWRHGDMYIKLFLLIVNALHWFNPLAYRINKDAACLCENACDEFLARNMDKTERLLYGELILSSAACENTPSLCSGMSEGTKLKRRLLYMLKSRKMKRPVMILAILAACAVLAVGVWLAVPINSVAAYSADGADDIIDPGMELGNSGGMVPGTVDAGSEVLGALDDEGGILLDGNAAIYIKGRKAVHMTIDGYDAWVASGEKDTDVYDFAERVIYTPVGKGSDEQMYMRIDDYKAWAAAGENDADVYKFAEKLSAPELDSAPTDEMPDNSYLWPLADYSQISSQFGTRIHPVEKTAVSHDGIDIPAESGTPILAAKAGTIIEMGKNDTDGRFVLLDHGAGLQTFYAQMNGYVEGIAIGDIVEKGAVIGYVGSTGASTGNHLHFGISIDGVYVNPLEGFN